MTKKDRIEHDLTMKLAEDVDKVCRRYVDLCDVAGIEAIVSHANIVGLMMTRAACIALSVTTLTDDSIVEQFREILVGHRAHHEQKELAEAGQYHVH